MSSIVLIKRFPNTLTDVGTRPLPRVGRATVLLPHKQSIATSNMDVRKGDRERVVILGSGWAGTYHVFLQGISALVI